MTPSPAASPTSSPVPSSPGHSEPIVNVEEWISPYYFTSGEKNTFDARVRERRKDWNAAAKEKIPTPRSRWTSSHRDLLAALTALDSLDPDHESGEVTEAVHAFHQRLLGVLGYRDGGHQVTGEPPVTRWSTRGVSTPAPLVVVEGQPLRSLDQVVERDSATLLRPWSDGQEEFTSIARVLSSLFVDEDGPQFALVLAGRWAVVAEQRRWAEGRYLGIDLRTVLERNDTRVAGEVDRALTCLDAESLAPDEAGEVWWAARFDDSVTHTVGVSEDLREGVRLSIETIANEVVARRRAQGLEPLAADQAQPLAMQSLRYLYRILFLLYAEASPELGVLPVGAPEYEAGYSLARLRELVQVPLTTAAAANGTHLHDSLATLVKYVDQGHAGTGAGGRGSGRHLTFRNLRADLFLPRATSLIDEVKLGNRALQTVLSRLLLSKEKRGRERGYISYAELGINQLGAVYEGLMSYTGFFATTELVEVAPGGNAEKGSWVVPRNDIQGIVESDVVMQVDPDTGARRPRVYAKGEFVFRLSGRDRQRSASFYTPEVLTKFVVGQALAELLDPGETTTAADELLSWTICEPALGSGAFAIETVRQVAAEYLRRKQVETGRRIDPDEYPQVLQRTKAAIALHQVYGVDLNATAVEFAEITLWLDTMAADLDAPWFGLHLRRGNSLVGARHAVYSPAQVRNKAWLTTPATDVPLSDMVARLQAGEPLVTGPGIAHWLLPAAGWGATAGSKEAKLLAGERTAALRDWRKSVTRKPTAAQVRELEAISRQAEELWGAAWRRLSVAEQQSRRPIPVWGQPDPIREAVVTREQIEASLADEDGAYRRLRRVMDAWCALWFWPLTGEVVAPPSLDEWIAACGELLGRRSDKEVKSAERGQAVLSPADEWEALAETEHLLLSGGGAQASAERVLERHPWLRVCQQVAAEQGFFHWPLEFATVFARGGFDLQVGNPPWVRPRGDVDALLAESDPWWVLAHKPSQKEKKARRERTLAVPGAADLVVSGDTEIAATAGFVGDVTNYPVLAGLQPDFYRCFMSQVWAHSSPRGVSALLHPESHFTDERAAELRFHTYRRLRRHWQFVNELRLFSEIHDLVSYGVHVYAAEQPPAFRHATALYHPDTVVGSLRHDGSGPEPGFKVDGHWDQRPHRARIQHVTADTLRVWHDLLESEETPVSQSRMVYTVNQEVADVLAVLARADRVRSLDLRFSRGWDESIDRAKGYFVRQWARPSSWRDVILQGPHLHVANPAYKVPNPTMRSNEDWTAVDLETLPADAIPATAYQPAGDPDKYETGFRAACGDLGRSSYRLAWRSMAANTGERTLIPAILPPGAAHLYTIRALAFSSARDLAVSAGVMTSLVSDLLIRSVPRAHILLAQAQSLPLVPLDHPLVPALVLRTLRLNCLTEAYADLWRECWDQAFTADSWASADHVVTELGAVGPVWEPSVPLRRDVDRRQALVEIDALVAVMLGVSAEELATVYRTQFAVLHDYDTGRSRRRKYYFDANGRLVPTSVQQTWHAKGDHLSWSDRTVTLPSGREVSYEMPFRLLDREADLRHAHATFTSRL